jgi:hypothetical protein
VVDASVGALQLARITGCVVRDGKAS